MAFAPMGPEASFFEAVDRHRASLLAALRGGGGGGRGGRAPGAPASSSEVLASIENTIQDIVKSLARNEAPAFTIDSRSSWENIKFKEFYKVHHHRIRLYKLERAMKEGERKTLLGTTVTTKMKFQKRFEDSVGLQMVCNCAMRKIRSDSTKSVKKFALILKILSMIYKLVQSNTYATKRDIYYTDSQLFGNQTIVDNIINDISCMLKLPRRSLHILSTSKGLIAGNLRYMEEDGTKVNCTCGATAVAVPSNIQGIQNAKFLLIVEKDATFQRLLDDSFCHKMSPCIMVTGKGVPDLNTRLLVRKLWDTFQIPIFTLVDADPHGIEIMCIYKYGSMSMSFEAHNLTVPAVRWLGLLPSDVKRLNISKDTLIPLTKQDQMKLDSILKRPYVNCQPFWKQEMELMAESKTKAEIQALTSLSSDYLSRVYLPNKLKFGGWI